MVIVEGGRVGWVELVSAVEGVVVVAVGTEGPADGSLDLVEVEDGGLGMCERGSVWNTMGTSG